MFSLSGTLRNTEIVRPDHTPGLFSPASCLLTASRIGCLRGRHMNPSIHRHGIICSSVMSHFYSLETFVGVIAAVMDLVLLCKLPFQCFFFLPFFFFCLGQNRCNYISMQLQLKGKYN